MTAPWGTADIVALESLVGAGLFAEALSGFEERARSYPPPAEAELRAAMAAARLGVYARAKELGDSALKRFASRPDNTSAMHAANLLGGIAFEQGRYLEAEAHFEETIRLARELEDVHVAAKASNNLGSLAHLRGKDSLAMSLYRGALATYETSGDQAGLAQTRHNLAVVLRSEGRLAEALESANRAVAAASVCNDAALHALALMGQAEILIGTGEFVKARVRLDHGHRLAQDVGDQSGLAEAQRLEGLLALHEGRYDQALRRARRGYALAARLGNIQLKAECASVCSDASRALERPHLADGFRRSAVQAFRSLGAVGALRRLQVEGEH